MAVNQNAPFLDFLASNTGNSLRGDNGEVYLQYLAETGGGTTNPDDFTKWALAKKYQGQSHQQIADSLGWGQGGADAWLYDPKTDTVNYRSHDDEFDPGTIIQGLLAAGVGGLAMTGAGIGAGAAGGGLGATGIEAGALAGAPGYGTALDSSLASIFSGAGAGSANDIIENVGNITGGDTSWGVNPAGGGIDTTDIIENVGNVTGGEPPTGMTWDPTINNYVDPYGNVLDQSPMPGNTPGYTAPTVDYGYTGPTSGPQTGGGSASGTSIGRILSGASTADDWIKLLGQLGPSVLGVIGSNNQSNDLHDLANQYLSFGAPYRDQLSALMKDPSTFYNSPEASQAFDVMARKLSIGGNPAGDPYKQATLTGGLYGALQNKEQQLANFGGLSALTGAAPGAMNASVGSNANIYNAVGAGLGNVFNPPTDLQTLLTSIGKNTLGGGGIFNWLP